MFLYLCACLTCHPGSDPVTIVGCVKMWALGLGLRHLARALLRTHAGPRKKKLKISFMFLCMFHLPSGRQQVTMADCVHWAKVRVGVVASCTRAAVQPPLPTQSDLLLLFHCSVRVGLAMQPSSGNICISCRIALDRVRVKEIRQFLHCS